MKGYFNMHNSGMEGQLLSSIKRFVAQIEQHDNLKIVAEIENGSECGKSDILVIEDSNIAEGIEGHNITVDVPEIFAKCGDEKQAKRFVDVVNCTANPIRLEGVTRIVGYYSRVNNWNKSKIGELRDRQKGQYGTGKHVKEFHKEAMATVNAM
jgi:hypothetical protein